MTIFNVILFGESGAGKSSIINMLAGRLVADISSGARGCTFLSKGFDVNIEGKTFRFHDTAGLDEGDAGRVPKSDAIVQLYKLVKSLDTGVSLLIFCMRAPRIKDAAHKNWRLFHEIICKKKVPIAIAITGLEQEEIMDDWWRENKGAFQNYDMNPVGFACITGTRGKRNSNGTHKFDEEYEQSYEKMSALIRNYHLERPWCVPPVQWFKEIIETTYESRYFRSPIEHREIKKVAGEGIQQLVSRCEMSFADAKALGEKLEQV